MGGFILIGLLALLILLLLTPAIRARLGGGPTPPREEGEESPHEVVVRKLDDHRARKSTPRDDPRDN